MVRCKSLLILNVSLIICIWLFEAQSDLIEWGGALYRFTDPIRYLSSILLIDIRYVSTIFSILSSNRSIQTWIFIITKSNQPEICNVERSFPLYYFPLPNQSIAWIVSLFHIYRKDCVIIMLISYVCTNFIGNLMHLVLSEAYWIIIKA